MSGQMNVRGMTMASGSISGPALANGNIAQALAAVQRAKAVWQGLLNKLSASDILGGGGGGGGGSSSGTGSASNGSAGSGSSTGGSGSTGGDSGTAFVGCRRTEDSPGNGDRK